MRMNTEVVKKDQKLEEAIEKTVKVLNTMCCIIEYKYGLTGIQPRARNEAMAFLLGLRYVPPLDQSIKSHSKYLKYLTASAHTCKIDTEPWTALYCNWMERRINVLLALLGKPKLLSYTEDVQQKQYFLTLTLLAIDPLSFTGWYKVPDRSLNLAPCELIRLTLRIKAKAVDDLHEFGYVRTCQEYKTLVDNSNRKFAICDQLRCFNDYNTIARVDDKEFRQRMIDAGKALLELRNNCYNRYRTATHNNISLDLYEEKTLQNCWRAFRFDVLCPGNTQKHMHWINLQEEGIDIEYLLSIYEKVNADYSKFLQPAEILKMEESLLALVHNGNQEILYEQLLNIGDQTYQVTDLEFIEPDQPLQFPSK